MFDKPFDVLLWIIGGCMTIVGAILGTIWRRQSSFREKLDELHEDISEHKLSVERDYPRTAVVEKMLKPISDNIIEVKSDVKSLINRELNKNDKH